MKGNARYNEWKNKLFSSLIENGVKKKTAKKIYGDYQEEFNANIDPESLAEALAESIKE
jgi:hypothetical protein